MKNIQVIRLYKMIWDLFKWVFIYITVAKCGSEKSKFVAEVQFSNYLSRPIV